MSKNKTTANTEDVLAFLNKIEDDQKRTDCLQLVKLMEEITSEKPVLWGSSIVGFGNYHYKYESGREGDFFLAGFSPRKQNISIYLTAGLENYKDQLAQLGKHKVGKSCLYVKKMADIDEAVLKDMIVDSVQVMRKKYP